MADYGLYLAALPLATSLPRGDEHPVLVLPGFLADDMSTRPCASASAGSATGCTAGAWAATSARPRRASRACATSCSYLNERYDRPVTVIGWSLGGIFARDLARRTPDAVRQVITLGSPFRLARHSQSRATKAFDRYSHLHIEHRSLPLESESVPLTVPTTSIYSHYDGIVHWQTCLNTPGERCENIAVMASHLGLGHHPAAIWAVADRLAQPRGHLEALQGAAVPAPGVPEAG